VINSMQGSSFRPVGYRFPSEVIAVAVRWYLRYGLSYAISRNCWPSVALKLIM
jgi:transposase-like protein